MQNGFRGEAFSRIPHQSDEISGCLFDPGLKALAIRKEKPSEIGMGSRKVGYINLVQYPICVFFSR